MRSGLAVLVCLVVLLAGCGSSVSSVSSTAKPPTANVGGPYTGTAGTAMSFSGAASSDPQGQTLTYAWNFGDGSTGTGVAPTHTYSSVGTYTVTLTVTNTSGLTGTATGKATIAAAPLVVTVSNATRAYGVANPTFTSTITGALNGDTFTIAYSTTATTASAIGSYAINATVSGANLANYSLTVVPGTLTITPLPPTANAGGPYTGTAGTAVSFTGAASSDPQGQTLTYAWSFGDSSTGTGATPTHTYSSVGTYTVTLTVTNTSGLSGSASATATIAVAPLTDVALTGVVSSGSTPIVGAHVYLLAANTTGYGGAGIAASSSNASLSLLSAAETGTSDSLGAYVTTGSNGGFSLTGDYTCTSGQQLYLYALGGNTGSGTNSASGLLAVVGSCPASGSSAIFATVNEVTTIAAAYAFAGFATEATHVSSSGTTLAQTGIANAFANAANLATLSTGAALTTTPSGNGLVPQKEINILANILASCVNTASSCSTLLSTATADGTSTGTKPTETATVAINIAHYPGANYTVLSSLASTAPIFSPTSGGYAEGGTNNFTLILVYTGGGLTGGSIAVDGSGNVWIPNAGYPLISGQAGTTVTEISSSGYFVSGTSGYSGGGLNGPSGVAIDTVGNAWIVNEAGNSITVISGTGSFVSGNGGYTGGGLSDPFGIAIDGSNNAWIANYAGNSVTKFYSTGSPVTSSPYTGGGLSVPEHVAIDGSGNVWVANYVNSSITEFNNSGTIISGANGYTGGLYAPNGIAIDGSGNAWVSNLNQTGVTKISSSGIANYYAVGGGTFASLAIDGSGSVWVATANGVTEVSNSGSKISTFADYNGSGSAIPSGIIAIDGSGNTWLACSHYVVEFIGTATPVVTPLAVGVKNNTLGTRP